MSEHMAAASPPVGQPITAVFLIDGSRLTEDLIRRWRTAGHRVAAIVVPRRRRHHQSLRRIVTAASASAPIRIVAPPIDWNALAALIKPVAPDILLSWAFPKLVPAEFLSLFPRGGVNFHPALLPYYRGPQPMMCMVADGTWQTHGGMTLHVMTDRYDRGDILASIAFKPSDWQSAAHLSAAATQAVSEIALEVVPLFCAGLIKPKPQPSGDFPWARYVPRAFTVMPQWTTAHLAAAGAVLRRRPGLFVEADRHRVRIGRLLTRLSPAAGRPPAVRLLSVELDCADGRVSVARANRLGKIADWIRCPLHGQETEIESLPIQYEKLIP
jgi:methionyl-tRNA formyltransferase